MANFRYMAKTAAGESVDGVMQAESEAAVLRTLTERELFPVHVKADEAAAAGRGDGKVRARDVGALFAQLADLLRAGVPVLRAMDTLAKAVSSKALAVVVRQMRDDVSQGKTLADAMKTHPKAFAELHYAMVYAGEEAGFLEDVLENLADFIERQDDLRSKVRGMMVYPLVLVGIGGLLMTGILIFLVPEFKTFFADMDLPLPTRILFAISELLVNYFGLLVALLLLLGVGVVSLIKSEFGHNLWQKLRLNLPLLGKVNKSVAMARFCRILGTMLHNGVPILRALQISRGATGSEILAAQIDEAAENVKAGETLAEPFRQAGTFNADVLEMIAVAEESNQIDKVLVKIADTVEKRTNRQVDTVVRLVEPLILVFLAVAIGFIAVGLLYPIFLISQTLG